MNFINLTPHAIVLNNGTVFESTGTVARVSSSFTEFNADGICCQQFGEVVNLPAPQEGTCYIVSSLVLTAATAAGRSDCVAPATGHPGTIRNEQGHIVSVPGFVRS